MTRRFALHLPDGRAVVELDADPADGDTGRRGTPGEVVDVLKAPVAGAPGAVAS
jgi:hypothetical protein